jgi:hypothetical protein
LNDFPLKLYLQVFDITFCGDWAGNVWSSSSCASKASTCNSYVQNNPSAFTDTYWRINSLKVYQESSGARRDTHPHAAAHVRDNQAVGEVESRRTAPYVRPAPRPAWKHRRSQHQHGHTE